jgi:hypothetical protein
MNCKIYRSDILHYVLDVRGTCSPTLMEELRTRELQNRVFKNRPKTYEVTDERMK